jgi:hypothetical protein
MGKISRWFPPFTGVLFTACFVAANFLLGSGEDPKKKTPQEIVNHFNDQFTRQIIGVIVIGLACVTILYFGGWLRKLLRDAEGPSGILSAVVFGGAVTFAAGAAIAGSIHFALVDLADDLNPIAVQSLNGLDDDLFLFFPVGIGTLILTTGISALRHGALPRWLAWASLVLGIVFVIPATFWVVFFIGPLWFLVVSIWGIRYEVGGGAAPTATPPAAPAAA